MEKSKDTMNLINSWDVVNQAFTPSESLSSIGAAGQRQIAELSLVSGRREYWAAIVSLADFADSKPQENEQVIKSVFSGFAGDVRSALATEYLAHAEKVTTLSQDAIQSATRSLSLVLGSARVFGLMDALTKTDICLELYPDDPDELAKCINL